MNLSDVNILALIGADTALTRVASARGGEHAGPCPFCGGKDRFRVWPQDARSTDRRGRFWCRQCGKTGDAAQYVMTRDGVSFPAACERLGIGKIPVRTAGPLPAASAADNSADESISRETGGAMPENLAIPNETWQTQGEAFTDECKTALWERKGTSARTWLRERGFTDDTLRTAHLGFNAHERFEDPRAWGLPGKTVWLPVGVVIPYWGGGALWRVQIRRSDRANEPRYVMVRGGGNALWNADGIDGTKPAALCEGVFTALTVQQCAGDLCVAVATSSTTGARLSQWIARLALAPVALVAFDADEAGDQATGFWLNTLPAARRLRPYWGDANDMARDGADVRAWIEVGLSHMGAGGTAGGTAGDTLCPVKNVEGFADQEATDATPLEDATPVEMLNTRFREYLAEAEAADIAGATEKLRRRDPHLCHYLMRLLEEREADLGRVWAAFHRGEVRTGAVLYLMERWAEVNTSIVGCVHPPE